MERAIAKLEREGMRVTRRPTTGPRTAAAIAEESIAGGAELILAVGGDGTINEVANGMVGSAVPLAILPAGTANVLAMEMGIGRNLERAALRLAEWTPERIAVGRVTINDESRYFLLMAGVGLDAHIVYTLNARLKDLLGKGAYWISGFGQLSRMLAEFDVQMPAAQARASFALASRVSNYGGDLSIARGAHLLKRDFEMVLFTGKHPTFYLRYLAGVMTGRVSGMRGVTVTRAEKAAFSSPADARVYVQVDGEYAGRLPARVEIVADALTLLVPPGYRGRLNG